MKQGIRWVKDGKPCDGPVKCTCSTCLFLHVKQTGLTRRERVVKFFANAIEADRALWQWEQEEVATLIEALTSEQRAWVRERLTELAA